MYSIYESCGGGCSYVSGMGSPPNISVLFPNHCFFFSSERLSRSRAVLFRFIRNFVNPFGAFPSLKVCTFPFRDWALVEFRKPVPLSVSMETVLSFSKPVYYCLTRLVVFFSGAKLERVPWRQRFLSDLGYTKVFVEPNKKTEMGILFFGRPHNLTRALPFSVYVAIVLGTKARKLPCISLTSGNLLRFQSAPRETNLWSFPNLF